MTFKEFWSGVRRTAAECVELAVAKLVAESEVGQLDVEFVVEQDVLSLVTTTTTSPTDAFNGC